MPLTVGTAGHIDHGKTALVEALTGKNTDRLPGLDRVGEVLGALHLDLDVDADIPGRLVLFDLDERDRWQPGECSFHERTRQT